jgi:hypothetical protein
VAEWTALVGYSHAAPYRFTTENSVYFDHFLRGAASTVIALRAYVANVTDATRWSRVIGDSANIGLHKGANFFMSDPARSQFQIQPAGRTAPSRNVGRARILASPAVNAQSAASS